MFDTIKNWFKRVTPFGNSMPVQAVLYTMVIVFFLAVATHCSKAKSAELDIVSGSTIIRGPTGVIGMNLRYPNLVAGFVDVSGGFAIIGSSNWCSYTSPKYAIGQCYNSNQSVVHAQAVAHLPWNFELGIGSAHLQHADNYNSGSINFSLSLQHQIWASKYPHLYWRYQHFSNAGTHEPNVGRDMLLITYRVN